MAFSSGTSSSLSATPNITPLIDVLLVLLIIFMVIVPVAPRGLETSVAEASHAATPLPEPSPFMVGIIREHGSRGGIVYELGGKVLSRVDLSHALARQPSHRAIWIVGDRSLDYNDVVCVISEATRAGYTAVGLLLRTHDVNLRETGVAR